MYLSVKKGMPKKSGQYYFISKGYNHINIDVIDYTVEAGWNTCYRLDGTLNDKYAFNDEVMEDYLGYAPVIEEVTYVPKDSMILEDMFERVDATRKEDPALHDEDYSSDEEATKYGILDNLYDSLSEAIDAVKELEVNKWYF